MRFPASTMTGLKDYIAESHKIVAMGLTKKLQKELGVGSAA